MKKEGLFDSRVNRTEELAAARPRTRGCRKSVLRSERPARIDEHNATRCRRAPCRRAQRRAAGRERRTEEQRADERRATDRAATDAAQSSDAMPTPRGC